MTSTWKEKIQIEMDLYGESLSDIVSSTISEDEMNKEFNNSYGLIKGIPFTVWTANRVYFPVWSNRSAEWCNSVARNPDGEPTYHIG